MRGINRLQRHGVEFNILILISQTNEHRARTVYRSLVEGLRRQQARLTIGGETSWSAGISWSLPSGG